MKSFNALLITKISQKQIQIVLVSLNSFNSPQCRQRRITGISTKFEGRSEDTNESFYLEKFNSIICMQGGQISKYKLFKLLCA